jgi:hypothetical protein
MNAVADENVELISDADESVVAAMRVVVHRQGVADNRRMIDAEQRVISAAFMVGERSGLSVWNRFRHRDLPRLDAGQKRLCGSLPGVNAWRRMTPIRHSFTDA